MWMWFIEMPCVVPTHSGWMVKILRSFVRIVSKVPPMHGKWSTQQHVVLDNNEWNVSLYQTMSEIPNKFKQK